MTLQADTGTGSYSGCSFRYETENDRAEADNGISWYYRKGGTAVGRILERHADCFTDIRSMDGTTEEILATVTELPEGQYIIRCFGSPDIPVNIPLSGTARVEMFSRADILFLRNSGISLDCRPDTYGVLVLNAGTAGAADTGKGMAE